MTRNHVFALVVCIVSPLALGEPPRQALPIHSCDDQGTCCLEWRFPLLDGSKVTGEMPCKDPDDCASQRANLEHTNRLLCRYFGARDSSCRFNAGAPQCEADATDLDPCAQDTAARIDRVARAILERQHDQEMEQAFGQLPPKLPQLDIEDIVDKLKDTVSPAEDNPFAEIGKVTRDYGHALGESVHRLKMAKDALAPVCVPDIPKQADATDALFPSPMWAGGHYGSQESLRDLGKDVAGSLKRAEAISKNPTVDKLPVASFHLDAQPNDCKRTHRSGANGLMIGGLASPDGICSAPVPFDAAVGFVYQDKNGTQLGGVKVTDRIDQRRRHVTIVGTGASAQDRIDLWFDIDTDDNHGPAPAPARQAPQTAATCGYTSGNPNWAMKGTVGGDGRCVCPGNTAWSDAQSTCCVVGRTDCCASGFVFTPDGQCRSQGGTVFGQ